MRSWFAIWVLLLGCVFVAHTAAASTAPYDTCCMEECRDEMGVCVAHCTPCTQPAATVDALLPRTAPALQWGPAHKPSVLPFPAYTLWTPPG
ncbi:MAG: hypothetical protein ACK41V_11255 [Acidovorax sp.]|uniref:hypothetical protein n=1 Tax=Acidovorax sp. TaxID=1872122 RepID=UPI00391AF30D